MAEMRWLWRILGRSRRDKRIQNNSISITIRLISEHQSIPADKTHSGFTKRWLRMFGTLLRGYQKGAGTRDYIDIQNQE